MRWATVKSVAWRTALAICSLAACGVAMFWWPPAIALLVRIEPWVTSLLFGAVVLLVLGRWIGVRLPNRTGEAVAARLSTCKPSSDLVICAAFMLLFLLPVVSLWNSHYPTDETAQNAFLTRLPWSDAAGYWEGAVGMLEHGKFDTWNYRRPLNSVLYSVRLGLSGLNFEVSLLMQACFLAFAAFLAAKAVRAWYGTASAVAFVAALYSYARTYVGLTLSEALGLTLGCLALAGFAAGMAKRDQRLLAGAMFTLGLALFARTGAMLVLPALVVWFALTDRASWRGVAWRSLLGTAAVVLPVALNKILTALYGQGQGMMNDNFAYVILGLTMGTSWAGAQQHYWSRLQNLPIDQRSLFMYRRAWKHLQADPWVFVGSLRASLWRYLQSFPEGFARLSPRPEWTQLLYGLGIVVCATVALLAVIQVVRRSSWTAIGFWGAVTAGVLLSMPFIWMDGGLRVTAATYPLFTALGAAAVASKTDLRTSDQYDATGRMFTRSVMAIVVASLLMPGVLHLVYATPASPGAALQPDEVLIDGYTTVGVEVVDRRNPSDHAPQIEAAELPYTVKNALGGEHLESFLEYPRPYVFFLAYDLRLRYPIFVFAPPSSVPPRARVVAIRVKKTHRIPFVGYMVE